MDNFYGVPQRFKDCRHLGEQGEERSTPQKHINNHCAWQYYLQSISNLSWRQHRSRPLEISCFCNFVCLTSFTRKQVSLYNVFFTAFLPHSHISFCFYLKVVPWCKCASAFNWWATNEPHSLYSLEKTSTKTCTHTHAGTRTHTHTQRHTSSRVWFFFYWTRTSKIILSRLSNSFVTLEIYSNVLTHFYTCWSKTRQLPSKSPALWVLPINLSQIGPLR